MENLITKPTELSLHILRAYVSEGDVVIDATSGNGHDTLALARLVGSAGKVYSFDIQQAAIENTKLLLEKEGFFDNYELILGSHHLMNELIPESHHGNISAVVFNLGYLPGGGKDRTTLPATTLEAVKQSLAMIRPGGIVAAIIYSGHPQGAEEKEALLRFSKALPHKEYHAACLSLINQQENPPELLLITKKSI